MTDPSPRRAAIRRAIEIPCVASLERGLRLFGQRAFDLSTDGALVETRIPVACGERVVLTLGLPGGGFIHARGEVVRIVSNRRDGDRSCGVAVRFDGLDAERRAKVQTALRGIPPTIPQRALRVARAA